MILVLFLTYEVSKGTDSYWFPYLRAMPYVEFSFFWDQKVLDQIEDEDILDELRNQKLESEAHWFSFRDVL